MKTLASVCLLALAASFPACVAEENSPAAKKPGAKPTTSKPSADPQAKKPAAAEKTAKVSHTNGADAAKLLAEDTSIAVLDVRTPGEYAEGHIKGAKNIDFRGEDFAAKIGDLDKSKRYLVHCKSGGRSGQSLAQFEKLGFANIVHLDDGFDAWKAAGHPVAK